MVHQKSDCENIVLSAKDKELLKEIKNSRIFLSAAR